MPIEQVRLDAEDFEALLPCRTFRIASKSLQLTPLTLSDSRALASAIHDSFGAMGQGLADRGVPLAKAASHIPEFVEVVVEHAPQILSVLSGLHVDDVRRLPLLVAVDLMTACLDINTRDRDFFAVLSSVRIQIERLEHLMGPEDQERYSQKSANP